MTRSIGTFCVSVLVLLLSPAVAVAQRGGAPPAPQVTQPVGEPRFEYAGPTSAGRIASAAAVTGKPGVYYAGAASGGVWKSTDGGATWKPTFDNQTSQAIGALAVSQSNRSQMVTAQSDFEKLMKDVEAFNKAHTGMGRGQSLNWSFSIFWCQRGCPRWHQNVVVDQFKL